MANRQKPRGAETEVPAEELATTSASETLPADFPVTGGDPMVQPVDGPEVPPEHLLDHVEESLAVVEVEKEHLPEIVHEEDLACSAVWPAPLASPSFGLANVHSLPDHVRACYAYERMCKEEGLAFPRWFDQDQTTRDAYLTALRHHDEIGGPSENLFRKYID